MTIDATGIGTIIVALATLSTALATLVTAWRTSDKITGVHKAIDGRMDQLVASSRSLGAQDQRAETRADKVVAEDAAAVVAVAALARQDAKDDKADARLEHMVDLVAQATLPAVISEKK